jgi:hypothetical protein
MTVLRIGGKREQGMFRALCDYVVIGSVIVLALGAPARAQDTPPERKEIPALGESPTPAPAPEAAPAARSRQPIGGAPRARAQGDPDRIRGLITSVDASSIVLKTRDGKTVRLGLSNDVSIFRLTKASYTGVDFGTYVGAVSEKLGDHIYSPIVRDSLSWLHKGFELRIIDEELRGIAVGHTTWDLTRDSVMTHGWVDDQEGRVISIKYGPTEEEETDVEVSRDTPVLRMSRGDRSLIKPGAHVFAGAQKGPDGGYAAVFIFVGVDGMVPSM